MRFPAHFDAVPPATTFVKFTNAAAAANDSNLESYVPSGVDVGSWVQETSAAFNEKIKVTSGTQLSFQATTGSNQACYFCTAVPPSADYTVQADYNCIGNSGVYALIQARTNGVIGFPYYNGYALRYRKFVGWHLLRIDGGTEVIIGTSTATSDLTIGQIVTAKLVVSGTTITAILSGSVTASWSTTDATYSAAGFVGLRFILASTTSVNLSNISAYP